MSYLNILKISISILLLTMLTNTEQDISKLDTKQNSFDTNTHFCGESIIHDQLMRNKPRWKTKHERLEQQAQQYFTSTNKSSSTQANYTLPVVVHIIHDNGAENISDALVLQGIEYLNDAYENVGVYDPTTGVNTQIEFCLARRDPDGNASNGITRTVSSLTELTLESEDVAMKDLSRWDPLNYINIWLVREICSSGSGCGVAGYAYFPSAHGNANDGIVLESRWMGLNPGESAVLTHEAGHYLGLYHTFQGGCTNNDCLTDGDRVCDTPPDQSTAVVPCNATANTCMSDVNATDPNNPFTSDQNDMFWNYMDYGDWDCYSAFTQGQSDRMEFFVNNVRFSLLDSKACSDPCNTPVSANFLTSNIFANIGETISFTNNSINGDTYEWLIDGVLFSNDFNSNYTFSTEGSFEITLVVYSDDPNCNESSISINILVTCPVEADFDMSVTPPVSLGGTVNFTNTSINASSYSWTLNGAAVSSGLNYTNTFNTTGVVEICLEATGNTCEDLFCQFFNVEDNSDCTNTYFQIFGAPEVDEGGSSIVPTPEGNLLVTGYEGNDALIMLLDPTGVPLWQRSFNFAGGNQGHEISNIILDSENNIVGSGYVGSGNNARAFAFKYDMNANNILWTRNFSNNTRMYNILEKNPGGNYLIVGDLNNSSGNAGNEAVLMELDRNSGAASGLLYNYYLGPSSTTFAANVLHDDALYFTGRYTNGGGFANMRGSLSKFDLDGNELWSKLYFVSANSTARLYGRDIILDDDALLFLVSGDKDGTSASVTTTFLVKTDLDGNLIWVMEYDIAEYTNEWLEEIITVDDGYLLLGYSRTGVQDVYIIKTDKLGNAIWAKTFGGDGLETISFSTQDQIIMYDDHIYLTAETNSFGNGDLDLLLLKIKSDGEFEDNCIVGENLMISNTPVNNPVQFDVQLTRYNSPVTQSSFNGVRNTTDISNENECTPSCIEICDNGLDDDLDGYVDCFDTECDCEEDECVVTDLETNFAMRLAWESTTDLVSVDATPVVANLNPQVDDIPEIICGISSPIVSSGTSNRLLIFRGDGLNNIAPKELNIQSGYDMYPDAKPVVGDVNGDGIPELLIISADRRIRVYSNYNESSTIVMDEIAVSSQQVAHRDYTPFLADFDGDGISEVYCGNEIFQFDFSGTTVSLNRVLLGTGTIAQMARRNFEFNSTSPVAVDVLEPSDCGGDPDCEGLELVAGHMIYSADLNDTDGDGFQIKIQKNLNDLQNQDTYHDGYTSVADMNQDGILDIIVAGRRNQKYGLYIWDKNGLIQFFPKPISDIDDLFGALPCIANVYDDTQSGATTDLPEVILSYRNSLICWNLNAASLNPSDPYWWNLPGTDQSGLTGVTVFDFNGDGFREVVYRDEDNLRIMYGGAAPFPNGVDNNRNWETFIAGSGTFDEHPIVADVDNDKQAEIVVTSFTFAGNNTPVADYRGRLRVFESDTDTGGPWLSARDIWNQYNYFVVNVNDDLSIPAEQQQHHLEFPEVGSNHRPFNNFLAQVPILNNNYDAYLPVPDASVEFNEVECGLDSFMIELTICNIGDALLSINTPVAFYLSDPQTTAAILYTIEYTPRQIEVDSCDQILFTISNLGSAELFLVVNDDNSFFPPYDLTNDFPVTAITECDFSNNITNFEIEGSILELDLGPDITICENGVFTFDAGLGFDTYRWQDGSSDPTFTAWESGTYWVEVSGSCGGPQRDSVMITIEEASILDLGLDTTLCGASELTISLSGFDDYQWLPSDGLDCSTCSTVTATVNGTTTYTVVASTILGCISVDSITIFAGEEEEVSIDTIICQGEVFNFAGVDIPADSTLIFYNTNEIGCDSNTVVNVIASQYSSSFTQIDTMACAGSSVFLENTSIPSDSLITFYYSTINNCDSVIVINVVQLDTFLNSEEYLICAGDSLEIFGNYESTSGIYTANFSASNGCDSTSAINLNVLLPLQLLMQSTPTCIGDSVGTASVNVSGGLPPYTFLWNTNEVSSELNNLKIGTYELTVTDDNDCEATAFVEVEFVQALSISTEVSNPSCYSYSDGTLVVDSSYLGLLFSLDGISFQSDLNFADMPAGTYTLYIQDEVGCVFSQEEVLVEPAEIFVNLPNDTTVILGCPVELRSFTNSSDSLIYQWSPLDSLVCADCPRTIARPYFTTNYELLIIDESGCEAKDDILISIEKPRNVYIPNVFSPNLDGINDEFLIYSDKEVATIVTLKIFDRWGELVFQNDDFPPNDASEGWKGDFKEEQMGNGVFVYVAVIRFLDGVEIRYQGDVTLLR